MRPLRKCSGVISAALAMATLYGCAGSPAQLTAMSPTELASASNTDLCNVINWRGAYSGRTPALVAEMKRRGLDCDEVEAICKSYGLQPGTPEYGNCMVQVDATKTQGGLQAAQIIYKPISGQTQTKCTTVMNGNVANTTCK